LKYKNLNSSKLHPCTVQTFIISGLHHVCRVTVEAENGKVNEKRGLQFLMHKE